MGKVFKYGDNVDTDVIIPARYLNDASEANLKAHAMEDIDPNFALTVKPGDIIVGGYNFGCGSSREHAPLALKASGIKLVIAKSFARIFFRNAINTGLLVVEDEKIPDEIDKTDTLSVDSAGITNMTTGKRCPLPSLDGYVQSIIEHGGLMNLIKEEK